VNSGGQLTAVSSFPAYHLSWILLLSLLACGCGGKLPGRISGAVTLDDAPLHTGTVVFHPASGGANAYGTIDKKGNYSVSTGTDQGLVLGEYAVTVVATTGPPPEGKLLIPARYGNAQKSGLRFTVNSGSNQFNIPLVSR
jgi:hypothetical protein